MKLLRHICTSLILLSFIALITGCIEEETSTNTSLTKEKPPKASIEINNEMFETRLSSYCWKSITADIVTSNCSDTSGLIGLLEGKNPIKVKPGENIVFLMDYEPKPNKFHVVQISENKETGVVIKNNRFNAPTQKGIYHYSYGVWWMDEKEKNVSLGDAFYAFVLEVD